MKLLKNLAVVALLGLTVAPAWSQSYFQGWDLPNSESGNPVMGGNVYGEDVISSGIQNNGLYMMFNDTVNPNNFFLGGYFQRFGNVPFPGEASGEARNFTGMRLSVDVSQIPVNGVINTPPAGSFFFFELAFDKGAPGFNNPYLPDGVTPDLVNGDGTRRTSLNRASTIFALPGTTPTTFSVDLTALNFSIPGDNPGTFDLSKVTRIGFGLLQNVPDNGSANFQNLTDYGWRFDNLRIEAVPESSTMGMMLVGLTGLAGFLRRRK